MQAKRDCMIDLLFGEMPKRWKKNVDVENTDKKCVRVNPTSLSRKNCEQHVYIYQECYFVNLFHS